jgi:hypothetical protein
MAIMNAWSFEFIDWSMHDLLIQLILSALGYILLWFFWQGKPWARYLTLLVSAVSLAGVLAWNSLGRSGNLYIILCTMLSLFQLVYLKTKPVRVFFQDGGRRG